MQQKKNTLIKNYLYNTAYQLLVLIAPLITTPYVSRVLGASGIGIYSYTQSIATYFVLVGAVGTTLYGQREIAYVQDNPKGRSAIFYQLVLFRSVTVLACTIIYYIIFGHARQYGIVYRILTLEVLAAAFDISWFFMGMEDFKVIVIRNTIIKLSGIILIFLLVKEPDDIPLYTLCLTLPVLIGNISLWLKLPKYLVKVSITLGGILKHIKPVLILFVPQIATEVYIVLDKTMIGVLASNIEEVGYYTQGQKIIKIILLLVTSLGTVMLPAMSFAFAKGDNERILRCIKKAFQFVFMMGFALLFGICGVAKNFVPLFFGKGYERVVLLMVIISPVIVIIAISNVIGKQYLVPTMQQSAYTVSVVAGAAVNFLLNCVLIPRYDAVGASVATIFAELSVTGVQIWFIRKQMKVLEVMKTGIKYMIIGAAMGGIVYGIGERTDPTVPALCIQTAAGAAFYFGMLFITKDSMLMEGITVLSKKRNRRF